MLDTTSSFASGGFASCENRNAYSDRAPRALSPTGSAGASPSQESHSQAAKHSPATEPAPVRRRKRKPWSPDAKDHLIFQWVKFEGKTQGWVASQLSIDQATVSRIVERYERWQAHFQPGQPGRLAPDERVRAQLWLTYERNEQILASALRIANEMEGFVDVTKSTARYPLRQPSQETQVETQHATVDRSGVAARFLRLAHRINMDQLELVEREPLTPLPPLTEEDEGDWEQDAWEIGGERPAQSVVVDATEVELTEESLSPESDSPQEAAGCAVEQPEFQEESAAPGLKLHKLHNDHEGKTDASMYLASTCDDFCRATKNVLKVHR